MEKQTIFVKEFQNNTTLSSFTRDDFSRSRDHRFVRSSDLWNFLLDSRKNSASRIIQLSKWFMDSTDLKLRFHRDSEIHKLLDSIRLTFSLWQSNTRGQCDSDERKRTPPIDINRGRSIQIDLTAVLLSPSPSLPLLRPVAENDPLCNRSG